MRRSRFLIAAMVASALTACAVNMASPPQPVAQGPVTQPVKVQCLPMVPYSVADQNAFAAEVEALKQTGKFPQVIRFLGDYEAMRNADRACNGAR